MQGRYDYECGTCGKAFPSGSRARDNHCNATGHEPPQFECPTCSRWFYSPNARRQHANDANHWPIECSVCDETFATQEACEEHEQDWHLYCGPCGRYFQSANNLKMV